MTWRNCKKEHYLFHQIFRKFGNFHHHITLSNQVLYVDGLTCLVNCKSLYFLLWPRIPCYYPNLLLQIILLSDKPKRSQVESSKNYFNGASWYFPYFAFAQPICRVWGSEWCITFHQPSEITFCWIYLLAWRHFLPKSLNGRKSFFWKVTTSFHIALLTLNLVLSDELLPHRFPIPIHIIFIFIIPVTVFTDQRFLISESYISVFQYEGGN